MTSMVASYRSCQRLPRNVEVGAQHAVVALVVEQEGVVAVRRVDLGVADVDAVVEQRLDDLARARAGEKRQSVVKLTSRNLRRGATAKAAPGRRRVRAPGRSSRARA
jgi:hypothetical protein